MKKICAITMVRNDEFYLRKPVKELKMTDFPTFGFPRRTAFFTEKNTSQP